MEELDGTAIIVCIDAAQWESWLSDHHDLRTGVWLKIAKKGSGTASVTPLEALETCLCYGWIDSQRRSHDETHFLQKYSPRRPKSSWSKVNVEKVETLITAGRMRPPGLAEVSAARAGGRWGAAYASQRNASTPSDLTAALEQNNKAKAFYGSLNRTDQYAVMLLLTKSRTPASRATRLHKLVALLEVGQKP